MKKLHLFKLLLCSTIVAAATAFTGCSNDKSDEWEIPSLEVLPATITFDENGGTQTFNITTTAKWAITGADGATWLAITPALTGQGNQTITLTAAQSTDPHTVTLKIKAFDTIYGVEKEVGSKDVVVSQSPGGVLPSDEIIYNEAVGAPDGQTNPLVANWTNWTKNGTGASTVSYLGTNVSIRHSGLANTGAYPGASGPEVLFFGSAASFTVKQITLTEAQTKLKLTFGASYSFKPEGATDYDNVFPVDKFKVALSADGVTWTDPMTYSKNDGDQKTPYWVFCTADFTLTAPTTSLYIKFSADVNSVIRLDDITLKEGLGGQSITLGGGSIPDPDAVTPIKDIKAGAVYTAEGTVVAVSTKSFLVQDNTGTMLVYMGADFTNVIGDQVKVKGTTSAYGGLTQFAPDGSTPPQVVKSGSTTVNQPNPTVLDGAAMNAYVNNVKVQYVQYTGLLTISGTYYNIAVDGATVMGSLSYPNPAMVPDTYNNATVIVTGYAAGTASSNKYLTTIVTDVKLAPGQDGPAIVSLNPASLSFVAGGESKPVQVTLRNGDGCTIKATPVAPFTATVDGNTITVTAPANATDGAINASMKIELLKADQTVADTENMTLTQAASLSPDATLIEADFRVATTFPEGFPTKTGTSATTATAFTFNGATYKLLAPVAYYNNASALFFGKTKAADFANSAYLELPVVAGKKLVKVELTMGKAGGKNIAMNVYDSAGNAVGGADFTTSGGNNENDTHAFDVTGAVDTAYRLTSKTDDKNLQIGVLKLYYE